jgi:hypothetical protein
MQMPDQTRHHLRKPGICPWACGGDDCVCEVRVESRDFGGVGSVGSAAFVVAVATVISRNTGTGLVGDEVQRLVGVHIERLRSLR